MQVILDTGQQFTAPKWPVKNAVTIVCVITTVGRIDKTRTIAAQMQLNQRILIDNLHDQVIYSSSSIQSISIYQPVVLYP